MTSQQPQPRTIRSIHRALQRGAHEDALNGLYALTERQAKAEGIDVRLPRVLER